MAKHTVTNVTNGPKVLNSIPFVTLQPGQVIKDAELSDDELDSAERTEWFKFDSEAKPLDEMSHKQLDKIAKDEGIDVSDARTIADKAALIQLARDGA